MAAAAVVVAAAAVAAAVAAVAVAAVVAVAGPNAANRNTFTNHYYFIYSFYANIMQHYKTYNKYTNLLC